MSWFKKLQRNASETISDALEQQQKQQQYRHYQPPTYGPNHPTPENCTLFQTFEWHTPSTPPAPHETRSLTSHYALLTTLLPSLASLGLTTFSLPPGCKANNPGHNGYDCYDLWDLGEFDQKYTRSTKWGSIHELRILLDKAHELGVECIWDAVLNHKTAGDRTEECWAVECDPEDRRVEVGYARVIEAWLKYEFPGRAREGGMRYSGLKWGKECFNGTDWDQRGQKNGIFKIVDDPATYPKPSASMDMSTVANTGMNRLARLASSGPPQQRPGKGWAQDVDDLHGNFDYLLFTNIDHTYPPVREDMLAWADWMIHSTGVDGFRLDAVQHYSSAFCHEWIARVQTASLTKRGKPAFIVGEAWTGEIHRIFRWLDAVGPNSVYAYDSCLFYNMSRISEDVRRGSRNADLRTILRSCLTAVRPANSVTFVSNHDTQPGQTSYAPLLSSLKPLFYAFILLRAEGVPCVFWGDLYGTQGKLSEPPACLAGKRSLLADLVMCRKLFAYGEQTDYWDAQSCIAWTRSGTHDRPGCAVVISISKKETVKKMWVGRPGEVWVDALGEEGKGWEAVIDENGFGGFGCKGGGMSVYVRKEGEGVARLPTRFEVEDVYGRR